MATEELGTWLLRNWVHGYLGTGYMAT